MRTEPDEADWLPERVSVGGVVLSGLRTGADLGPGASAHPTTAKPTN